MRQFLSVLMLGLALLAPAAFAEDRPRAGLLWNQSGLPSTLPLQVKTFPGKDYVLYVTDPETDRAVMAAYIRGGEFFRLLVPPGSWTLRFAFGSDWQSEVDLFGDQTDWTQLDAPLDFRASTARRHGHVVTLIEQNGRMVVADAADQTFCQIASWRTTRHGWDRLRDQIGPLLAGEGQDGLRGNLLYLDQDLKLRQILCG
ncbi:hypothetical protein JJJ17_14665 [Paracoccus caeni]|uniref:Uncharacterized protein n=1 Tax=Paracoccus caeni TaxID=657651 RepID=A0A934VVP4_9RHOB|nr:hypothetical protein [Paracoccus caeni]MBK4217171.1 hypothetical protein [Paracoccus caeni]